MLTNNAPMLRTGPDPQASLGKTPGDGQSSHRRQARKALHVEAGPACSSVLVRPIRLARALGWSSRLGWGRGRQSETTTGRVTTGRIFMLSKRILTAFCAFGLLGYSAGASQAQQSGPASAAQTGMAVPEQFKLDLLVRTTIIAINQANITGNYTVFRDLTAPVFQVQNSPARLAEVFSTLRKRNLDLSPVVFFQPKFQRPPAIENGLLRMTGFFATRPEQVNFDLAFQNVNGRWLLVGVSITTAPNTATASAVKPDATASAGVTGQAPAAQPKPAKPRPARAQAPKPGAAAADTAIEPKTTSNFARVDLGQGGAGQGNAGQGGAAPLPERRPAENAADSPASAPQAETKSEGAAPQPAEKPSVWPF